MSSLVENLDKLHTTELGQLRIQKNLCLAEGDVVGWCKEVIKNADVIFGLGKNWYVYQNGIVLTVNAKSFTVITAHKLKAKVRPIKDSEIVCLNEFLYQAIFVPEGERPPLRSIINEPEISVYVENFGEQPGDLGVVAEQNGQIIGAAWTRIIPTHDFVDDQTPELAISMFPEFRGYGIGTKMLLQLFEILRNNGYKQTALSVQSDNPALKLYEKLGYELLGNKYDHAGHEDCLMLKQL